MDFITNNFLFSIAYILFILLIMVIISFFADAIEEEDGKSIFINGTLLTILLIIFSNFLEIRGAYHYYTGKMKIDFEKIE